MATTQNASRNTYNSSDGSFESALARDISDAIALYKSRVSSEAFDKSYVIATVDIEVAGDASIPTTSLEIVGDEGGKTKCTKVFAIGFCIAMMPSAEIIYKGRVCMDLNKPTLQSWREYFQHNIVSKLRDQWQEFWSKNVHVLEILQDTTLPENNMCKNEEEMALSLHQVLYTLNHHMGKRFCLASDTCVFDFAGLTALLDQHQLPGLMYRHKDETYLPDSTFDLDSMIRGMYGIQLGESEKNCALYVEATRNFVRPCNGIHLPDEDAVNIFAKYIHMYNYLQKPIKGGL